MKNGNNASDIINVINKNLNKKFLKVLDNEIKHNLEILKNRELKHMETFYLLQQSYHTIINAELNLKKYNFVDANTLLRSSIEYLIMGFMINKSDETFNEFIILNENTENVSRKYTVVNTLLCKYGKNIKKIAPALFTDVTNKECELMMTDMYGLLCKYSHASIVVSLMTEIQEKYQVEIVKELMAINLYFIKILILYTILYLIDGTETEITDELIGNTFLIYLVKLCMIIDNNKLDFKQYTKILYLDSQNSNYYLNFITKINALKSDLFPLQDLLNENKNYLVEMVNQYLQK